MEDVIDRSNRHAVPRRVVAPHRWAGQGGCLVGPFSSRPVAQQFEHYVLHRGGVATPAGALRELRDGWYIAVPPRST